VHRRFDIRVCRGPVCAGEREADAVHARLAELLAARDLGAVVELERQSCFGRCRLGPNVHVGERLAPELLAAAEPPRKLSAFYNGVSPDDADEIVTAHVLGGRAVERLIYRVPFAPPFAPPDELEPGAEPGDSSAPGLALAPVAERADTASPARKDPERSADVAPDPR
jgi:(2Fe-2S) ferredoxin